MTAYLLLFGVLFSFQKRGGEIMNKTLQEQLVEKGLLQPAKREIEQEDTRRSKKRKEQLSERDLAELMGTNRQTYGRARGGAFRQR